MFSVTFAVTGLPAGAQYQVRFSNSTQVTELTSFGFQIPNGSYTFDVAAPTGYYPSPAHGTVAVNGTSIIVKIAVLPIGRGPNPPFWTLVTPAAVTVGALGLAGGGVFALLGVVWRRRGGASP